MATRIVLALLAAAAVVILGRWWPPFVLAAWFSDLLQPLLVRMAGRLGGRRRAAALVTASFTALLVIPAGILGTVLVRATLALLKQVKEAGGKEALRTLVSSSSGRLGASDVVELARKYGAGSWQAITTVAGVSASIVIGVFLFLLALYAFSAQGPGLYRWALRDLPLDRATVRRLTLAFRETGRGLLIGFGLTAAIQGVISGIAYVALGVPSAIVLGFLTALAGLLPVLGTPLVWAPVAAGLMLTGHVVRAAILVGLGLGVIGVVDNVLRPVLARFGHLQLSTFVVIASMFGGVALLGTWGVLLGPLLVRLGQEALAIARDTRRQEHERAPARPSR